MWLGYLEEFPDYQTQGATLQELQDNLKDIYVDLMGGEIPNVRRSGETPDRMKRVDLIGENRKSGL